MPTKIQRGDEMPKASPEKERIEYLISLLRVSDIDTRWRAARTLAALGDRALSPLMSRIYDDDDNVRLLSIWALGRMGDSRAAEAVSRCRDDDNHFVKMASEGAVSRLSQKD